MKKIKITCNYNTETTITNFCLEYICISIFVSNDLSVDL